VTIYTGALLPFDPSPAQSKWSLIEQVGMFTPLWGAQLTQRVRYGVQRWRCELVYESLSAEQRHNLAAFVAYVGKFRPFVVHDTSHNLRGSFPSSELLTAGRTPATWSGSSRAFTTTPDGIRVTRNGGSLGSTISTASGLTVVANAVYALRASWEAVRLATNTFNLIAGPTAGTSSYGASSASAVAGRHIAACLPTGATLYPGWIDNATEESNWAGALQYDVRDPSLVRAFRVDGGTSPTDQGPGVSSLYVKDLVVSSDGQLLAGDMVEVVTGTRTQMVRLTHNLDGDSAGKGRMLFEPPLRWAASTSALVIPRAPRVRMILSGEPEIDTRPGWFSDVTLVAEEVFE